MITNLEALLDERGTDLRYPIDRRSDVRQHVGQVHVPWTRDDETRDEGTRAAILRDQIERADEDLLRFAVRRIGESESWVRTFSRLVWKDKSATVVAGTLLVAILFTDVGGIDPMPIC